MGGRTGHHHELRVVADQNENTVVAGDPAGLGVERCEIGQVLVDQAGDDEIVGAARSSGRADICAGE